MWFVEHKGRMATNWIKVSLSLTLHSSAIYCVEAMGSEGGNRKSR